MGAEQRGEIMVADEKTQVGFRPWGTRILDASAIWAIGFILNGMIRDALHYPRKQI